MISSISFAVSGDPISQPRQRHRVAKGIVMNYTPSKHPIQTYKADIQKAIKLVLPEDWDVESAFEVELIFVRARPAYLNKKKIAPGRVFATTKPDVDNFTKGVLDALNKIAWKDDAQVIKITAQKYYAAKDENAHTEIKITKV